MEIEFLKNEFFQISSGRVLLGKWSFGALEISLYQSLFAVTPKISKKGKFLVSLIHKSAAPDSSGHQHDLSDQAGLQSSRYAPSLP